MTNSFNTMIHEWGHCLDALVLSVLNIEIDVQLEEYVAATYPGLMTNGFNWDRDYIHGALAPTFPYIGRRGTTFKGELLKVIAPLLRQSYEKRQALHDDYTKGLKMQVITLLKALVVLYRSAVNKKNGSSGK